MWVDFLRWGKFRVRRDCTINTIMVKSIIMIDCRKRSLFNGWNKFDFLWVSWTACSCVMCSRIEQGFKIVMIWCWRGTMWLEFSKPKSVKLDRIPNFQLEEEFSFADWVYDTIFIHACVIICGTVCSKTSSHIEKMKNTITHVVYPHSQKKKKNLVNTSLCICSITDCSKNLKC